MSTPDSVFCRLFLPYSSQQAKLRGIVIEHLVEPSPHFSPNGHPAVSVERGGRDFHRESNEAMSSPPFSTSPLLPDIPGYRIQYLIAEGGMASVYLAIQESLNRPVALKLLRKFEQPAQTERFLNEARLIASLNHRHIITIHDVGVVQGRPYISMEYLQGGDLEARIARGMSAKEALDLIQIIGDCLAHVHRQGIIHRDIKPANILFHLDGTPILTDFGIAKQIHVDSGLTLDGLGLGSPYYLSPEQAQSSFLDGRADIYGLGILFYEMLTGTKPYQGRTAVETILAHITEPIPRLPPELRRYQSLLERLIAKSPDQRFASAEAMLAAIRELNDEVTDFLMRGSRTTGEAMRRARPHESPQIGSPSFLWTLTLAAFATLVVLLFMIETETSFQIQFPRIGTRSEPPPPGPIAPDAQPSPSLPKPAEPASLPTPGPTTGEAEPATAPPAAILAGDGRLNSRSHQSEPSPEPALVQFGALSDSIPEAVPPLVPGVGRRLRENEW